MSNEALVDLQLGQDEFAPAVADVLRSLEPRATVEGVTGHLVSADGNGENVKRESFRSLLCPITIHTNTLDESIDSATAETTLEIPPDVWVIQLQRTGYRHDTGYVYKILRRVDFPLILQRPGGINLDLVGLVTHKGRSPRDPDSQVCAWIRDRGEAHGWIRVGTDTTRTSVAKDEIAFLSGGGDWHAACILFYRKQAI
jgi:hypothetical protein